jgi:hypothetical protein
LSELDARASGAQRPSVFLSYASEDRQAARLLRDALSGHGLDVWYDESELGGGEAWDQKIRRQIRECDFFMPLVSAQTERRHEGYFRREWRLAVERTLDMADDHPFLLPIVIDDTDQAVARVPEKFLTVQWLKVPGGQPSRALASLCHRIAGNAPERTANPPNGKQNTQAASPRQSSPPFPREEPGQRTRFWVEVLGWAVRSAWMRFKRLPRWIRIVAYVWLGVAILSRCHSRTHDESADFRPEKLRKEISREAASAADEIAAQDGALLAIPFTAPAGDAAAAKLADSIFAMAYGMLAISHHGQVELAKAPLPSRELGAALERGRTSHSTYILHGAVDRIDGADVLTVKIVTVADASVEWSKSYAAAGADASRIAAEIDANVPQRESTE